MQIINHILRPATKGFSFGMLILAIALWLLFPPSLYSQSKDTIATVTLHNARFSAEREVTFDLLMRSNSTSWSRFANATFEVEFADASKYINADAYSISFVPGSSNLSIAPMVGNRPTADAYTLVPNIRPGRIAIVLAGPDSIADCAVIPTDTDIRIGTFILHAADTAYLTNKFAWRIPIFDYQACAFKLEKDSMLTEFIKYASAAENMEMDDNSRSAVRYLVDSGKDPVFDSIYFKASYANNRKVKLEWRVFSEAYNKGYIIARGLKPYGEESIVGMEFPDTVVDYRKNGNDTLRGKGSAVGPFSYSYSYDTVQYRGEVYCYQLNYQDMRDGSIKPLAVSCVLIPSSVITHAEAKPNPFVENTKVEYLVDDDVMMTAKAYDITGEVVQVLLDNVYTPRNVDNLHPYKLDFTLGYKASQGLYEIVFIAKPVDDPSVESSVAVVKLQLVK